MNTPHYLSGEVYTAITSLINECELDGDKESLRLIVENMMLILDFKGKNKGNERMIEAAKKCCAELDKLQ